MSKEAARRGFIHEVYKVAIPNITFRRRESDTPGRRKLSPHLRAWQCTVSPRVTVLKAPKFITDTRRLSKASRKHRFKVKICFLWNIFG